MHKYFQFHNIIGSPIGIISEFNFYKHLKDNDQSRYSDKEHGNFITHIDGICEKIGYYSIFLDKICYLKVDLTKEPLALFKNILYDDKRRDQYIKLIRDIKLDDLLNG